MKSEDFEKFKNDQKNADVLEKEEKSMPKITIRSKAAKMIERLSGKEWFVIKERDPDPNSSSSFVIVEKFQTEVFISLRG